MNYCLGLCYDFAARRVLLIRKAKPKWQRGLLNGVGGKIEEGEPMAYAMAREFEEEVGIQTAADDWRQFCWMTGEDYSMAVFAYTWQRGMRTRQMEKEEPVWLPYDSIIIRTDVLDNLKWLVPMGAAQIPVSASVAECKPT